MRRTVRSFYDNGKCPTSAKILSALRDKIDYRDRKSAFKIILRNLRFKYKKCNDGRKFLIKRSDIIVATRVKCLRKMSELLKNDDTRLIVYLDETWVNLNNTRGFIW